MLRKSAAIWWRVVARIVKAQSRARRMKGAVLAVAAFLGLIQPGPIAPWLAADPDHRWIAALGLLVFLLLLGSYEAEGELDDLGSMRVEINEPRAELRSILRLNQGSPVNDVLIASGGLRFRNDSGRSYRAFFPSVVLMRRRGRGRRWAQIEIDNKQITASGGPRADQGIVGMAWGPHIRLEIPEREELRMDLHIRGTAKDDAELLLDSELKLVITIDLIGHPAVIREVPMPRITKRT